MAKLSVTDNASRPLCVDLDGTLIATDLLWESVCMLVRSHPGDIARLPAWLLAGRAYLKGRIAERVVPDVATLPYRGEVVEFLKKEKESGRRLILATASHERLARAVAEHVGLFEEVIATDGRKNLKGRTKLAALQARFGPVGFDYLGDSRADLPLWGAADCALIVRTDRRIERLAGAICTPQRVFDCPGGGPRALLRALRPHQWCKNILVFVPLITSHKLLDSWLVFKGSLAVIAFSLAASAIYIANDLLDLPADRKHASKRRRPFASGQVSIPAGVAVSGGLLCLALGGAMLLLPAAFTAVLAFYITLTMIYSVYLKSKLLVDVICLAGLYTLRIIAGGAAVSVAISPWLMAFSMFFFLSLAFVKRYTELAVASGSDEKLAGRGYLGSDLDLIRSVGPTSGYISVLVLCLYINSPDVGPLYRRPEMLWLLCPVLLYWISRVWFLAYRRQMCDDPIVFALRDRISYIAAALTAAILALAI